MDIEQCRCWRELLKNESIWIKKPDFYFNLFLEIIKNIPWLTVGSTFLWRSNFLPEFRPLYYLLEESVLWINEFTLCEKCTDYFRVISFHQNQKQIDLGICIYKQSKTRKYEFVLLQSKPIANRSTLIFRIWLTFRYRDFTKFFGRFYRIMD